MLPNVINGKVTRLLVATLGTGLTLILPACSDSSHEPITAESSRLQVMEDTSGGTADNATGNFARQSVASGSAPGSTGSSSSRPSGGEQSIPQDPFANTALDLVPPQTPGSSSPPAGSRPARTSAELIEFIESIEQRIAASDVPGSTHEEQLNSFSQLMRNRLRAAEQILAQQHSPEQRLKAAHAKLDSLQAVVLSTPPGSSANSDDLNALLNYAETLRMDEENDLRLAGTFAKLQALNIVAASGDRKAVAELDELLESLLTSDNPDIRLRAVQQKLSIMGQFIRAQIPDAREKLVEFANSVTDDSDPRVVEFARIGLLSLAVLDLKTGDAGDPTQVVVDLEKILQKVTNAEDVFEIASTATLILLNQGYLREATIVRKRVQEVFQDHENPQLATAAVELELRAGLTNFQLQVQSFVGGQLTEQEPLLSSVEALLTTGEVGAPKLNVILNAAINLEYGGHIEVASQIYGWIEKAYQEHEEERLAETATMSVAMGRLRLGLVGQSMELSGKIETGEDFDWNQYAGKVVLVDFWATHCAPCLAEIPNLKRVYEQFHDAGFEVVGVNLDFDPGKAIRFIEKEQLPWVTLLSEEDGSNPNAERYGVQAIPFVVLVGRDGKVAALHLRGPELSSKVEEMLGTSLQQPRAEDVSGAADTTDEQTRLTAKPERELSLP